MPKVVERPDGSKTTVFDMSDPADIELANKYAEKMKRAIKGETEAESKTEEELNRAEEHKQLFEELKSKVENEYINAGLRMPNITDKASLRDATDNLIKIQDIKEQRRQNPTEIGAGNLPLDDAQRYGGFSGFGSEKELIDSLMTAKHSGNQQAEKVLNELLLKAVKGSKEQEKGIKTFKPTEDSESEIQRLNRLRREKHPNYQRDD